MRRKRQMVALAALAAMVLPVPALADGPGPTCSLIPVPAAREPAPVGSDTCPGVRPGGRVLTTIADCTLNFLFRAPDGTRYIGTAGHCVSPGTEYTFKDSDSDGNGRIERIWSKGSGPVAMDHDRHRIGEFAYAVVEPPKDFALIRLDPGVEASPEMCHFGAPRGVYTTGTATAVVLHYYGNGQGIDTVAPARSAVALGTPNPDHVYAAGLALPGDSGAGVMTADGLAIGVLVTTGYPIPAPNDLPQANEKGVDVGIMGITRLGPQLARAALKLGVSLKLVTAG
jgi:hypothetical protein